MTSRRFVVIGFSLACLTMTALTGRAQQAPPQPGNVDPFADAIRLKHAARITAHIEQMELEGQILARQAERMLPIDPEIFDPEVPADGAPPPKVLISESTFDRLMFGGRGNAENARKWLDSAFIIWIENIDYQHTLSPAQRKRLRLAARGDIKRLFDQITVKRHEFQNVRNDVNRYKALVFEIRRLNLEVSTGPFGEGSLSAKVLKSIREELRKSPRID